MNDEKLASLVRQTLQLPASGAVDGITRENTPSWDSLKHIELLFSVEQEFGVAFEQEDFATIKSYAALRERVASLS